jgi:hypothetical protein
LFLEKFFKLLKSNFFSSLRVYVNIKKKKFELHGYIYLTQLYEAHLRKKTKTIWKKNLYLGFFFQNFSHFHLTPIFDGQAIKINLDSKLELNVKLPRKFDPPYFYRALFPSNTLQKLFTIIKILKKKEKFLLIFFFRLITHKSYFLIILYVSFF